jgi:3-hydroxyacyl-CoA dehydrogenase
MQLQNKDGIGVITIDSPPVNALGYDVRKGIVDGLARASADDTIEAIVLICAGRTFFPGADIAEFGKPMRSPDLREVLSRIEACEKRVLAAIHGTALGGGLELALACHYRIAVPSAKVGLPEVNLGILPGAGGTQRLPRIVGAAMALDMITSGRPIDAGKALAAGIVDRLVEEGRLADDALSYARELIDQQAPLVKVRDRDDKIAESRGRPELFDEFRKKNAGKFRGFKAPENIIEAVAAAVELPFDEGLKRERELFEELVVSTESAAQRYVFFAERQTTKIPDIPGDTPIRPIEKVAVIGAGTMGGGISMNFLDIGVPVTLIEQNQEALDRGLGVIRKNYERMANKGRISKQDVAARMALVAPALDFEALARADLIIEAVFESMDVKKDVFGRLDAAAKAGAILASNTSYLDLDEIAAVTSRPDDVVGLHFFSPANIMPLLEVVRGEKSGADVVNTAMKLAKKIGKTPVLARACNGFIANRAMSRRMAQADQLVLQGTSPADVDRVMYDYGFAMGPFKMKDLVGLDVIGRNSKDKTVTSELVLRGRLGQKRGGGYYDYDENRKATSLSTVAVEIIRGLAAEKGIEQEDPDDNEILARLLYPVVNEAAKILEEGIAIRASDIDIALIKGYNWPVYRGGPMFWADTVGLDKIAARMKEFEAKYGAAFTPASLLEKLASDGKTFKQA